MYLLNFSTVFLKDPPKSNGSILPEMRAVIQADGEIATPPYGGSR
jgi:hypothetical protein